MGPENWKNLQTPLESGLEGISAGGLRGADLQDAMLRQRVTGGHNQLSAMTDEGGIATKALKPFQMMRNFRTPLEDAQRAGIYKALLEKGYGENAAGNVFRKQLFDYGALNPAEKQVLQRAAPFYSWTRFNMPAQAENLLKRPGETLLPSKLINEVNRSSDTDTSHMSPSMVENSLLNTGMVGKTGNPIFAQLNRFDPAMDFNEVVGAGTNMGEALMNTPRAMGKFAKGAVTPFLNVPDQLFRTNTNDFTGQEIKSFPGEQAPYLGMSVPVQAAFAAKALVSPLGKMNDMMDLDKTIAQSLMRGVMGLNSMQYDSNRARNDELLSNKYGIKEDFGQIKRNMRRSNETVAELKKRTYKENREAALEDALKRARGEKSRYE